MLNDLLTEIYNLNWIEQSIKSTKEETHMASLSEEAKNFESKAKLGNIADLTSVSTDLDVKEDIEAEFPYKYVIVDGKKFKVPTSVLSSLKAILEENPNLSKFKVKKSGEGMETKYTVIPLA